MLDVLIEMAKAKVRKHQTVFFLLSAINPPPSIDCQAKILRLLEMVLPLPQGAPDVNALLEAIDSAIPSNTLLNKLFAYPQYTQIATRWLIRAPLGVDFVGAAIEAWVQSILRKKQGDSAEVKLKPFVATKTYSAALDIAFNAPDAYFTEKSASKDRKPNDAFLSQVQTTAPDEGAKTNFISEKSIVKDRAYELIEIVFRVAGPSDGARAILKTCITHFGDANNQQFVKAAAITAYYLFNAGTLSDEFLTHTILTIARSASRPRRGPGQPRPPRSPT
jgi:hypothetical protein